MSFFNLAGKSTAGPTGNAGSNSIIGSLNLDTTAPSDPAAKRKSIFEPSSTTEARSASFSSPSTNMFGSNPKPAATQSLFGQPAPATSSAPSGNLFGGFGSGTSTANTTTSNAPPASAPTGGLFGSKTQIDTNPSPGGIGVSSLFGASKPATTSSASTGLFGTGNTTTAPVATTVAQPFGLFGSASTAAPAQANVPNFGSTFGQSHSTQQHNQGPQSESNPRTREAAYFNGLLERQKKKVKLDTVGQASQLGQLPSMNLDLGDLARRAQELNQKNQKTSNQSAKESRAHYLLSASGIDPAQAYKEFQKMDGDSAPILPGAFRTDSAEEGSSYLKGMQTKGREAMLRETMQRVYRDVDTFIEENLGIDFDEQKTRIMQHFGLIAREDLGQEPSSSTASFAQSKSRSKGQASKRSIFGRSGLDKSMIGNASSIAGNPFLIGQGVPLPTNLGKNQTARDLRDKERRFMDRVEALNNSRSDERNYKILEEFKAVESSVPGEVPKQIIDAYTALEDITKENASTHGLRERVFAKSHAQSTTQGSTPPLRKQILEGSRKFLETSFFKDVLDLIQKHPKEAQLGGIPSPVNQIRAYIRIRASKNDLAPDGTELKQIGDAGDYCWAIIFYLLRSGHVEAALNYVNSEEAFQSLDRRFISYLMAYSTSADGRLGRKMQDMIDGEYQQRTKVAPKGTVDPYQIACYKVIGRCDLAQRTLDSVGQGVEDWIWLQFALARETDVSEDTTGEVFSLEQIVETITEIGQKHFQKSQADTASSYGTYFLMQILAGMFEQAVDYLYSFNPVTAVHLAIALAYYGLLRVADYQTAGDELLTLTTTQQAQINFVPLIAYYTTTFRTALPIRAVDYLALICLNSDITPKPIGEVYTNACHECLRELCLETREFAALLGDIRSDGQRIQGAIEQRARIIRLSTPDQFLRFITSQAAAVADTRGQIADAVLLYHLSDDYDNVYAVLNRALADAVAVELGDEPLSLQPLQPRSSYNASDTASQASQPNSSLSLTQSTSSPVELARNMRTLYENGTNIKALSTISNQNRQTLSILLTMLDARAKIEAPPNEAQYLYALEELNGVDVLPLWARGDISVIRKVATRFSSWPQLVTRCGGLVILWCVFAIGKERERLADSGSWEVAGMPESEIMKLRDQLVQMARDLMVFAGLVRYKLPSRVYDLLTRAGGDIGGY